MEQQNTALASKIAALIRMEMRQEVNNLSIPVGVSGRHIHLSQRDLEILFGLNYTLTELKPLSQPGQFAAKETVTIAGPKGSLSNVRVLGPVRKESQVEISRSDSFLLGIKAPVRESGSLIGSGDICVIGPKGSIRLKEKVIVAQRHIHMSIQDAQRYGVENGQEVCVVTNGERITTFGNVLIRVHSDFQLEFHIDTDEANAASLTTGQQVRMGVYYG